MTTPQRVALVTGANRGIGLEVTRQLADAGHTVYLASRDATNGKTAAASIDTTAGDIRPITLDVTDTGTRAHAADRIAAEAGRLDILINNAAIHYDTTQHATDPDFAVIHEALSTNVFGAWHTILAMLDLLKASSHGRIVNVSSGGGALTDMGGGLPAYRLSKVSLNALTRMFAAELANHHILVNSICPGWVATDLGGPGGRPVYDGAAGIVWAATLPDNGPTGGFFRDQQPITW